MASGICIVVLIVLVVAIAVALALALRATRPPGDARLFCAGDAVYFERHVPEVAFQRPSTLAEGGTCCDFRFGLSSSGPEE